MYKANRSGLRFSRGNNRGGVLLIILGMIFSFGILVGVLQYDLVRNIRQITMEKKTVSTDFIENSLLDYFIFSVKDVWCLGPSWTKVECAASTFSSDRSIRRMLLSRQALRTLGELYLLPGAGVTINPADWPACANQPPVSTVPAPSDRAGWLFEWEKCIGIGDGKTITTIHEEIDLQNLPSGHPLKLLFDNTVVVGESEYKKVNVTLKQPDTKEFPSVGRGVTLELIVELFKSTGTTPPDKTIKVRFSANPVELNHFGLVLAGRLVMDGSANSATQIGGNIPLKNMNLNSAGKYVKDNTVVGIHFDSPVFINNDLVLPPSDSHKFAYVNFASELLMGRGTVLQDDESFRTDHLSNRSDSFMLGIQGGVQVVGEDLGLRYIAGTSLTDSSDLAEGGLADGDQQLGSIANKCIQLNAANNDIHNSNNTANSKLYVELKPGSSVTGLITEYNLVWGNGADLTIRNTNRFTSPRLNAAPGVIAVSGALNRCYVDNTAFKAIFPQVYQSTSSATGATHFSIYKIPTGEAMIGAIGSTIANPAKPHFAGLPAETQSAVCPQDSSKLQMDAIAEEIEQRASVIANVEYSISVKDKNDDANVFASKYNAVDSADKTLELTTKVTALTTAFASVFPTGTSAEYGVKALMGFNTELRSSEFDTLVEALKSSLTEIEGIINGKITTLYVEMGTALGTGGSEAEVVAKVDEITTEKTNLTARIDVLDGLIAPLDAVINANCTVQDPDTPGTIDPNSGVQGPPTHNSHQDQDCLDRRAAKQAEKTPLDDERATKRDRRTTINNTLSTVNALLARKDKLNAFITFKNLVFHDLDEISDQTIALREYTGGIQTNVSTTVINVFHPSIAELRVQKPSKTNRYLTEFNFLFNAFDPTYFANLADPTLNTATACVDTGPGSEVVRTYIRGPDAPTKYCVEFKTTGPVVAPSDVAKSTISVKIGPNLVAGELEEVGIANVKQSNDPNLPSQLLKTLSLTSHIGLLDYACAIAAKQPGAVSSTDSFLSSGYENALAQGVSWGYSFTGQTNRSWYFAPIDSFVPFSELPAPYALDSARLHIDNDSSGLDLDGNGNPMGIRAFHVRSIMSQCIVKNTVKFLSGFFVCREFIIKAGRSEPLEIAGTVITGKLTIEDTTAIDKGVFFRNIYHPESRKKLMEKGILLAPSTCEAIDVPVWGANMPIATQDKILSCSPHALRALAQPFTWSKVDPDCGLIAAYPTAAGLVPERMRCKDKVDRYHIIETGRSQ